MNDIRLRIHRMNGSLRWAALLIVGCLCRTGAAEFRPLFPQEDPLKGWQVRQWNDVSQPAPKGVTWTFREGVLHGSESRGTWLVSEASFADFILEFEWRLGQRGNSGCGLRFPPQGDPAFDGLELQMVDPRYYGGQNVPPSELTGSFYRAVAPSRQVYKPEAWNRYRVECRGSSVQVTLNGVLIQDLDLSTRTEPVRRHDGSLASPLKDRPRRGHIGFQELSRGGSHVRIRNARIRILE